MKLYIVISSEAYEAIRQEGGPEFNSTGTKLANGCWRVPLENDTFKRLLEMATELGLSISDTILFGIAEMNGRARQ